MGRIRSLESSLVLASAVIATLPWGCMWLIGIRPPSATLAIISGMAIAGAAFLVSWASEIAQLDVSRSLSLAMLSLIAVMPEYAVDIYLSWRAGKDAEYIGLACANMTGGNRLLMGIGWSLTAVLSWWSLRKLKGLNSLSVRLERDIALEVLFLSIATIYSFLLPLKGSISLADAIVLSTIYIGYITLALRAPKREVELLGPAQLIASAKPLVRRMITLLLFAYSGFMIFISAEPLAESLKDIGKALSVGEFFMIQWIAPIASEAPELIVVTYFALRALPICALTAIISAKLNQWTLLISSLPIVYSISSGALNQLQLMKLQRSEILLTAAQSLFGCAILASFDISILEATLLFILFASQLSLPAILPDAVFVSGIRMLFSALYIALSLWMLFKQRHHLPELYSAIRDVIRFRCFTANRLTPQMEDSVGRASREHPKETHVARSKADGKISLQFCGAAMEVSGSCHLLRAGDTALLLDCGLIQGGSERHLRNREPFPFDPSKVNACVLTHAHLDHCGRLPLLVKRGFKGLIFATEATCELARIVLLDSAKLNEEDAAWKIKRLKKAGEDYSWVTPLFTIEDALECIEHFKPIDYRDVVDIGCISLITREAGHILGSAIAELNIKENSHSGMSIVYTGDLGKRNAPIIRDPELISLCDVLITEGTYAGQIHEGKDKYMQTLVELIERTEKLGGKLLIPSFAIERAQDVLYVLGDLFDSGAVKPLPVFVDSPMAIEALNVFERHTELYDEMALAKFKRTSSALSFKGLHLLSTVEESKMLNSFDGPCIIIAGNGMCTGGRIKHHLKHHIGDPRNAILFVGYQARGTLGRQILDGEKVVRIFGEQHEVRAHVARIEALSGHADQEDLDWWLGAFKRAPNYTFIVHGERNALMSLQRALTERAWQCITPTLNEVWEL